MSKQKSPSKQEKPFPGFDDEMKEILESFIIETREVLEKLAQDLLTLEKGSTSPDLLNSIFRAVHTVKGTSSFLGLEQMTELAHSFEDVLNKLRRGELSITAEKMDVILAAYDLMKELLVRIENKNSKRVDLTTILRRLKEIALTAQPAIQTTPESSDQALAAQAGAPAAQRDPEPTRSDEAAPAGEAVSSLQPGAPQQNAQVAGKAAIDTTIRVDVTRLDSLMNLVGELVLGRNRLTQIAAQVTQDHEELTIARGLLDTSAQIDFITTELQMAVMKTRMVPIAKVFNRIPRLVRDLCRETGKDIDLVMEGEETELDKTIIEELSDPLVHIIRNAADHGVELPEERTTAGKPARGTVRLAAKHEGNHIVITISDDGRGMDPEKLKAKAMERRLITEAQAREMSLKEILNLIFAPGFSTAAKVTNISGRGVGMDVVRTNIAKLKGIVEIDSEKGKGSTISIKLPLTLAIIQALLVKAGEETYCIPLSAVLEVVRVQEDEISTISGFEVVRLRDTVLPIARISRILRGEDEENRNAWTYIVVVALAEQRLGIVVDSMLGQKEVVIKPLGNYLGTVQGIAGSTILGDGQVIMIVDVGELMRLSAESLVEA
jgi:two-component system chemotaxis sensor kinase CheA